MRQKFCFAYDESYDDVLGELFRASEEHIRFVKSYSVEREPHLIFSTAYQDGLIHGFQRIVDRRFTNDFADLHKVRSQIQLYDDKITKYTRKRDYWNSSYFVGYQMALIYFDIANAKLDPKQEVPNDLGELPLFYHPGLGIMNEEAFNEDVRPRPEAHKSAWKQAKRFAKIYEGSTDIVVQHSPFG